MIGIEDRGGTEDLSALVIEVGSLFDQCMILPVRFGDLLSPCLT